MPLRRVSIVAWLLVAAGGIWYQLRDIGRDMAPLRAPADIDRSAVLGLARPSRPRVTDHAPRSLIAAIDQGTTISR